MALIDLKFASADFSGQDVASLPDSPSSAGITASELKARFDNVGKVLLALGAFNGLLDELTALGVDDCVSSGDIRKIRVGLDNVLETYDGTEWTATGSSGHVVVDPNGSALPQRSRLKFTGSSVTDDGVQTVVAGIVGPQGPRGEQGPQGIQGPRGEQGPQGVQGIQGIQGSQGVQGPSGITGPAGAAGAQGAQGAQGEQGPAGDDGRSFTVLALYPTLYTLQTNHSVGAAGDAYAVGTASDNDIYIWDEDAEGWANLGPLQGPAGPQGPQGIQGPQGETGPQGIQGLQGVQGPQGEQGVQGEQGPQGDPTTVNGKTGTSVTLNGADLALTGYAKPGSASAVAATDTVNAAVGKLEKRADNADAAVAAKADPSAAVTATLTAAGWTGLAAPYTQTVSVAGMTSTANGTVGLADSATAAQREAARNALLSKTAQASGSITIAADGDKPTVDIPIAVILLG
jgi:hypothetical protein